jgi:DNA-binding CsgD family transcriptional regulator
MPDEDETARGNGLPLALFAAIVVVVGVDVVADIQEGTSIFHVAVEVIAMALAAVGVAWLAVRFVRARWDTTRLRASLANAREDAERWRRETADVLAGLGAAIDREFDRWGLTPAEREVGLLLLKGLSHKEIAGLRSVSERTVREQARALYKKGDLSGRADLAAYFLEDLLLPTELAGKARSSK